MLTTSRTAENQIIKIDDKKGKGEDQEKIKKPKKIKTGDAKGMGDATGRPQPTLAP